MASASAQVFSPIFSQKYVCKLHPKICFSLKVAKNPENVRHNIQTGSNFSAFHLHLWFRRNVKLQTHFPFRAAASSSEYIEEPETKVKFQTSLSLPGCSSTLSLLGTGYREKVFAIIGVKVYAVGLYANQTIYSKLDTWRGRLADDILQDSSLFDKIFQAPLEKSLHIILVRDIDGKTFWDALDDAVSPRIKSPTSVDESALSTFRSTFQGRPLKKGTSIFLTWLDQTKMLVCVSTDGMPTAIDAIIESPNVTSALFDVFLGRKSVSPSLKASAANGLATAIN